VKGSLVIENSFVQKQIVLFEAFQHIGTKVCPAWLIIGLELLQPLKFVQLERQLFT
jgi:hypothetical protein